MTKVKNTSLNKTQGGSYIKDPKTGKRKLVAQTKQQKVTRLDAADMTKTTQPSKQQASKEK